MSEVKLTETKTEARQKKRLWIVFVLVSAFVPVQFFGAHTSESNVLLADAIHLVLDILALGASILAMHLSLRPPTEKFPFGFRRVEPLAALFNAFLVFIAAAIIVWEGIEQLRDGHAPISLRMLVFSVAALVINGVSAWLIHDSMHTHGVHGHSHGGHSHDHGSVAHASQAHHDHAHNHDAHHGHSHDAHAHATESAETDSKKETIRHPSFAPAPERHPHDDHDEGAGHALNLRSARLHLLGDTLGALMALVAAIIIHLGGPAAFDSIASFLVALILIVGAVRVVRDATLILLEAAPQRLDRARFVAEVAEFSSEVRLKHVHAWSLGAGHEVATVVVVSQRPVGDALASHLKTHLGLSYVTVQVDAA